MTVTNTIFFTLMVLNILYYSRRAKKTTNLVLRDKPLRETDVVPIANIVPTEYQGFRLMITYIVLQYCFKFLIGKISQLNCHNGKFTLVTYYFLAI